MPSTLADWLSRIERAHPSTIAMGLERVTKVRDAMALVNNSAAADLNENFKEALNLVKWAYWRERIDVRSAGSLALGDRAAIADVNALADTLSGGETADTAIRAARTPAPIQRCLKRSQSTQATVNKEATELNRSESVVRYDVIIIGAGPAGLYAAYYAGFRGFSVTVVDALPEAGGQISAMYPEKDIFDVAGFPAVKGRDLVAGLAGHGPLVHQQDVQRGQDDAAGSDYGDPGVAGEGAHQHHEFADETGHPR